MTGQQVAEQIAKYHVETNGWPGAGYHWFISYEGTVFWLNNLETISYHASGQNGHTVGICLEGNFMGTALPTDKQFAATKALIVAIQKRVPTATKVVGHKDIVTGRDCPGEYWDAWKAQLVPQDDLAILRADKARLTGLLAQIETLAKAR